MKTRIKILKIAFIGFSALILLAACGGGSSSGGGGSSVSRMAEKDFVVVLYNFPEEACSSQKFYDLFKEDPRFRNPLIQVASNSVSCATYGKSKGVSCETDDLKYSGNSSCVAGFDA